MDSSALAVSRRAAGAAGGPTLTATVRRPTAVLQTMALTLRNAQLSASADRMQCVCGSWRDHVMSTWAPAAAVVTQASGWSAAIEVAKALAASAHQSLVLVDRPFAPMVRWAQSATSKLDGRERAHRPTRCVLRSRWKVVWWHVLSGHRRAPWPSCLW